LWDSKWRNVLSDILQHGNDVNRKDPTRDIREIISYKFEIEDPRDRLLYDENRAMNIFQCIGHFLWITQGSFNLEAIKYYQPYFANKISSDGYSVIGAYGPRLFGIEHLNQMKHLLEILDKDPSKRRAVASVYLPQFDQHGLSNEEVPCTLNLQYLIRNQKIQSVIYMRSQDAFKVLPYDVFIFTMLQEYVQNMLKPKHEFELGMYNHYSGSFHVYFHDIPVIQQVISNKQSSTFKMPPMPSRDITFRLRDINKFESTVRTIITAKSENNVTVDFESLFKMLDAMVEEDYWKQFGWILLCYGALKVSDEHYRKLAYDKLNKEYQRFVDLYIEKSKKQTT